jgi:hypothetical protein
LGILTLSACATPAVMHTDEQLNAVALGCGLDAGELFQDESEKRLLFLMKPGVELAQRLCVERWARKNSLHLAVVEAINFPGS